MDFARVLPRRNLISCSYLHQKRHNQHTGKAKFSYFGDWRIGVMAQEDGKLSHTDHRGDSEEWSDGGEVAIKFFRPRRHADGPTEAMMILATMHAREARNQITPARTNNPSPPASTRKPAVAIAPKPLRCGEGQNCRGMLIASPRCIGNRLRFVRARFASALVVAVPHLRLERIDEAKIIAVSNVVVLIKRALVFIGRVPVGSAAMNALDVSLPKRNGQ